MAVSTNFGWIRPEEGTFHPKFDRGMTSCYR